ncbi:MAG: 6-phosphofructokinase [Bacteroidia bacterium]|nr:6-phosphofructokinase [Bacteroidia bacterium]
MSIKTIAVLTSGGDSPGMNAAIRAIVRTAAYNNLNVMGVMHGYNGLINNEIKQLTSANVGNIIQHGGTILKTSRSKGFVTTEGMQQAYNNIQKHHIDALIVIGGDGTFKGAQEFGTIYNFPIIGLPGTIDNDLVGTDFTIGYDTAINTVVEAVDRIRDTAASHDRLFFVEVMGRDAGLIALRSGIGVGAEAILMPETPTQLNELIEKLTNDQRRKKSSSIVIVAEGEEEGGAYALVKRLQPSLPNFDIRVSILGHIQRGGSPTAMDRVLASRMGYAAVNAIIQNQSGFMIGVIHNKIAQTPFAQATKHIQTLDADLLKMIEVLAM